MSLVSEQERRTLAAVGATRAAAMLASIAFGEEPAEENQNVPPGPQLMGVAIPPETGGKLKRIDVSVTSAGQRGKQLRTEKVANMQDKGHRYTLNSVRRTESYLSYVLHKDGIGKIRVLHTPMVCKALINCHTAPVVDHSLKMTRFLKSDTESGAVVASLDTAGLLAITAFVAPASLDKEEQFQKLVQRAVVKLQFEDDCIPDAEAKAADGQPAGRVDIGVGHVYVAVKNRLLCIDVEEALAAFDQGTPLRIGSDDLRSGVKQLVATGGDITALAVHPCGHEVAVGDSSGSVHVVTATSPLPAAIFDACCEGDSAPDTPQPLPVTHLAYLGCAPVADDVILGKTALISAVVQPSGSLQLSTWAVNLSEDKMTDEDMPQVLPVDTLCVHASAAAAQQPSCMHGGWVVRVHPNGWPQGVSGVVLVAQNADEHGEMHVVTVNLRTELVQWTQCSIGTTVANFEVESVGEMTEKSPSAVTQSIQQHGDNGEMPWMAKPVALVLRLGDGVATATIPCEPLTPPLPPSLVATWLQGQADDVASPAEPTQLEDAVEVERVLEGEGSGAGSFCSAASADVEAVEASLVATGAVEAPVATAAEVPSLKEFARQAVVATGDVGVGEVEGATNTTSAEPPVAATEPPTDIAGLTDPEKQLSGAVHSTQTTPEEPIVPDTEPVVTAPVATAPVATAGQPPGAMEGSSLLSSLLAQAAFPAAAPVATAVAAAPDANTSQDWAFQSGPVRPSHRGFNVADTTEPPLNGDTPPPPVATVAAVVEPTCMEPPVPDPGPPGGTQPTNPTRAAFPAVTSRTTTTNTAATTAAAAADFAAAAAAVAAVPAPFSASLLPQDLFSASTEQLPTAAAPVAAAAAAEAAPPGLRSEGSLVEALLLGGATATTQPSGNITMTQPQQQQYNIAAPGSTARNAPSATGHAGYTGQAAFTSGSGSGAMLPQVATPAGGEGSGHGGSQPLLNRYDSSGGQQGKAEATPRGAESPIRAGDNMARGAGVSGKALDKLDKRMHDSTNIVRGLQSTVTKLQNEVTKNNAEVAKALKAQAAVEKAIRGIEGSLEKMPSALSAAVAQSLQDDLPAAVRAHVGGVVAEAFRAAFTGSIVPAFEQAMHVMFTQVDQAVNQGLAEHLAATRAAMEGPNKVPRMHETPVATASQHITHNLRPGSIDPFNPPYNVAPPPMHARQQQQQQQSMPSAPVTTAAVAAGTFAQPHMHGAPMTNLAVQSASISEIIDSDRHGRADQRGSSSGMHGARAFQAGPTHAGAPPSAAPAGAQDRNLYGQPRELQPFAMGSSTTGATPVEASLLAGSIEGLGGAAHAQHAQHGPPGFPQRPQNHNRQNAPFQAATAGVAPSPIPAAALTPVPVQKPAAPQQVPQAAVGVGTRVGSRSAADDPELNELKSLIQRQDYPAVGAYCICTPAATASLLSPLHAACVSDMLCPAINAAADVAARSPGNSVEVVQLLEWLRGCVGHLLPEHHLQPGLIREILTKCQTAVKGVMEKTDCGEVIRTSLPLQKLVNARLSAFTPIAAFNPPAPSLADRQHGYVAVKPEGLGHATIKVVQKIALFLGERHQVDHESSDYLSTAWHD